MGGGSDDGGGYNPALFQQASPMPGVPVSSPGGTSSQDPFNYGKYQNFLPMAGSAHGLTEDMFEYKSPKGDVQTPAPAPPPAAPAKSPDGRYYFNPATGQGLSPGLGARDYLADMMAKRRGMMGGQQPAPAPSPPPPPAVGASAPTPDWMSASMLG
jgi:hypothetical protein